MNDATVVSQTVNGNPVFTWASSAFAEQWTLVS